MVSSNSRFLPGTLAGKLNIAVGITVLSLLLAGSADAATSSIGVLKPLPMPPDLLQKESNAGDSLVYIWRVHYDAFGNQKVDEVCHIPFTENRTILFGKDSFGCDNDEGNYFSLTNARIGLLAVYDKKCDDSNIYNDDFYDYKVTVAGLTTASLYPLDYGLTVGLGNELTPGLRYTQGYRKDGIAGKLSCVGTFSIQ